VSKTVSTAALSSSIHCVTTHWKWGQLPDLGRPVSSTEAEPVQNPKGGAIITREGKRTRHYDEAKRINAALKNLGPTLMKLTSTGVCRVHPKDDSAAVLKDSPIRSLSEGDFLIGTFRHADGRRAVLLNNYQFAYSAWPTVVFDAEPASVVEVDAKTGEETPVVDDSPAMPGLQISLDAGEGRLFLMPAVAKAGGKTQKR
jgi:hypothetical protein